MATIPASISPDHQAQPAGLTMAELCGTETRHRRWRILLAILIPVAVLGGGIAWAASMWARGAADLSAIDRFTVAPQTFNVVLKEKGELKASESIDIKCEVEGRSTIITLIEEGKEVKEGDLLVELASDEIDNRILQEELKEANAITAYDAAKAELDIQRDRNASDIRKAALQTELKHLELTKYKEGDWQQKYKDATIAIEQATISLQRRQEYFAASEELQSKNFITKTEYEEDKFAFIRAQWELEKAKMALDVLETYTHVADLRQRESDLDEALKEKERVEKAAAAEEAKKLGAVEGCRKELDLIQKQLAKLRTQKQKCRITAPSPGFVVYYAEHWRWGSENQIKEGSSVHEQQVLLSLPDTSQMKVVVRVHEAKTNKLQVGQSAVVSVEGVPDRQFTGKVTKIAVLADSENRWLNPDLKEYETEITLDNIDIPLKPGVTAHAEILVETVENRMAVPVQSVYSKGGRRYAFCAVRSDVIPTEIETGAIGTEWVEVTSGLHEGDQVLMALTDEHKRLVPDVPVAHPNAVPAPAQVVPVGTTSAQTERKDAEPGAAQTPGGEKQAVKATTVIKPAQSGSP